MVGITDFLTELAQWLGVGFVLLAMIIQLILAQRVYRDYLRNRSRTTLAFSLTFFSWGFALLFLVLERIFQYGSVAISPPVNVFSEPGILFAIIAVTCSAFAILFLDVFAIYATFPKHAKKLMILPVTLTIVYLAGLFAMASWVETSGPDFYEVTFPGYVRTSMLYTIIPLFFIPVIVLTYYSFTMRSRSPPHARRSAWLVIAILLVILSYIPEVIGPHESINYLRSLYAIATVIFYICFTRFIELRWPQKIQHLYLCDSIKGIALYDHSFAPAYSVKLPTNLVTGFIAGLSSLVQEITQTDKKLKVIDVEDVKIILEHGKYVIGILMTEENYGILRRKLRELVGAFEAEFKKDLVDFSGAVYKFDQTEDLVDQIFAYREIF